MISKNKHYRTRDGREVRIYATDGTGIYPIHGAIKFLGSVNRLADPTGWFPHSWFYDGKHLAGDTNLDLVEVKPRIHREYWISVYDDYAVLDDKEEIAKQYHQHKKPNACVKVVIDCEEGEGL